jgi:hypothetical protein
MSTFLQCYHDGREQQGGYHLLLPTMISNFPGYPSAMYIWSYLDSKGARLPLRRTNKDSGHASLGAELTEAMVSG